MPLRGKPSHGQEEEAAAEAPAEVSDCLILHSGQGICALSAEPEGNSAKVRCGDPGEEVSPAGGGCWLLLKPLCQGPRLLGAKLALGLSGGPAGNRSLLSPSSLPAGKVTRQLKTGEMRRPL